MRHNPALLLLITPLLLLAACKKSTQSTKECFPDLASSRQIVNKKATVKLTATVAYPVYLVEDGTIDTKLIPCGDLPPEFYQNDLQVFISGNVKTPAHNLPAPCCWEYLVITNITR